MKTIQCFEKTKQHAQIKWRHNIAPGPVRRQQSVDMSDSIQPAKNHCVKVLEAPKSWWTTQTRTHTVADIPMRAWNKLLWKISMTLWMERRSSRSSVHCSLDRYSSSSTSARCASARQQGESMNHITTSYDERHTTPASSSSQPPQHLSVLRLGSTTWSEALLGGAGKRGAASKIRVGLQHRLFKVAPVCDIHKLKTQWLQTCPELTLKKNSRFAPPLGVSAALQHYCLLTCQLTLQFSLLSFLFEYLNPSVVPRG